MFPTGKRDEEGLTPTQLRKLRRSAMLEGWGDQEFGKLVPGLMSQTIKDARNNGDIIKAMQVAARIGIHQQRMEIELEKLEMSREIHEDRMGMASDLASQLLEAREFHDDIIESIPFVPDEHA